MLIFLPINSVPIIVPPDCEPVTNQFYLSQFLGLESRKSNRSIQSHHDFYGSLFGLGCKAYLCNTIMTGLLVIVFERLMSKIHYNKIFWFTFVSWDIYYYGTFSSKLQNATGRYIAIAASYARYVAKGLFPDVDRRRTPVFMSSSVFTLSYTCINLYAHLTCLFIDKKAAAWHSAQTRDIAW